MDKFARLTLDAMTGVTVGMSAKHDIIGQDVYNDQDEKVGKVEGVLIAPDDTATYGIVGVGGFLGMGTQCSVPVGFFSQSDDGYLMLRGATRFVETSTEFKYDA